VNGRFFPEFPAIDLPRGRSAEEVQVVAPGNTDKCYDFLNPENFFVPAGFTRIRERESQRGGMDDPEKE